MSSNDFELSLGLPVLGAYCSEDIFEIGIGRLVVARRGPNGTVVFGTFMLDVWCLGIKDVSLQCQAPSAYERFLTHATEESLLMTCDPSYARKLLEEGAAYATKIGFQPTAEVIQAMRLLHDADPALCSETMTFGLDGAPYYESGPYDSRERSEAIQATLERYWGEHECRNHAYPVDAPRHHQW